MKKKFYNGMLIVAMLLATVGSYVSCKDYDEDAYADMLGKNSKLEELINEQIDILNEQIDALEQAQKECKENCEAWKQEITIWQQYVENNYVTVEEYNKHIAEYTAFVAENQAQHDALSKQIEDAKSEMKAADEALKAEMQAELLKVQNDLNTKIASLQTQLDELAKTVADNKAELEKAIADNKAELEKAIAENKAELKKMIEDEIAKLEERVKANETAIADIKSDISNLKDRVSTVETLLNKTVKEVEVAYTLAKNDSIRIDALETAYENLKEQHKNDNDKLVAKIDSICNELNTIKESVNEAIELANKNLELANEYTDERIEEVMNEIDSINTTLADLEAAYQAADAKLQDQIDAMQDLLDSVMKRVKENANQIKKLIDQYNKVDESLKQFITGILLQRTENPVFGSYSFPANIQTNVLMAYYGYAGSYGVQFPTYYPRYYVRDNEVLTPKDIEMLGVTPEMLAEDGDVLVSGAGKVYVTVNPSNVNFEGQTLPIVNSIEEESGIKLSPLKYSDKKLTFGTRSAVNGLYEAEATLAAEDIEKVKMTFDLNVGEIKETVKDIINPLDGVNVTQVANTVFDVLNQFNQNLDANALKASWTDELGVSRSIYSQYNLATTAIKPLSYSFMNDVKFTSFPGFDKMQNVAGRLLDKMAGKFNMVLNNLPSFELNIDKISHIKFDSIDINTSNINLDLVVTYKDTITTTVNIKIEDLIDIDINELVNVPSQEITITIPVKGDVKDNLGNIIGSFEENITKVVEVPSQDILVSIQQQIPFEWTGAVPVEVPVNIEIPVDMTEFKKILNEIEGMEDTINGMLSGQLDNVNSMIDTINSYLEKLGDLTSLTDKFASIGTEVEGALDNIKDKIANYLDKVENKLLTAVNSINKTLQPVMLVETTDGFQMLSQTIYNPTRMSAGNVNLIPTSYTAEIIAPAYKKLVGVTNVYSMDRKNNAQENGGDYLTVLRAANAKAGVAEIIDGDTQVVEFSAQKGYIYEVTYTSVDFSGMVVAKKYYVTVK